MNYFDCHADTLTEITLSGETLNKNTCDLDLNRAGDFVEKYTQIFAVWKDAAKINAFNREEEFLRLYHRAMAYLEEESRKISLCLSAEDMKKAHSRGKAAAFLSIEDISIMGSYVEKIRQMGFRFAMLTWNYQNSYGAGAASDQNAGLTEQGKDLVKELLRQDIVLDISHLSDAGALDLFGLTDRAVVASHSNVRAVCDNPRNLSGELLHELIRRKGLIGMNLYAPFVGENPDIQMLLRHMDTVLDAGGEDVLALGMDFDGCGGCFPEGIRGIQSVPVLRRELLIHGYTEELTEKIFFGNAARFVREWVR